jgi:2-polyprenyl-3-methyl-5-hydroxy-6-metoxy-1,4-benzoquinol methylase
MNTKEKQYRFLSNQKYSKATFGPMSAQTWIDDPKRLIFLLSRYKHVSKMLTGRINVLEVGCGDGFGSKVVSQQIKSLTGVDFDSIFISRAKKVNPKAKFKVHDMLRGPVLGNFDAVYSLDVLEHILPSKEDFFFQHCVQSAKREAIFIFGSPSLESQSYASRASREGHVNCKTENQMRTSLSRHFGVVLIFGMNDEVLHTGFSSMCHYRIAVCCVPKK